MSAEEFVEAAREKIRQTTKIEFAHRDPQQVCHELSEVIEGAEYIVEDAQFAWLHDPTGDADAYVDIIKHLFEARNTAQRKFLDNRCATLRKQAGLG